MIPGTRVELTVDLTRYHSALIPGALGTVTNPPTFGEKGIWSRNYDRFVFVQFDRAGGWDILTTGLRKATARSVESEMSSEQVLRALKAADERANRIRTLEEDGDFSPSLIADLKADLRKQRARLNRRLRVLTP